MWEEWADGTTQPTLPPSPPEALSHHCHPPIRFGCDFATSRNFMGWRRNPRTFKYVECYIVYTQQLVLRTSFRTYVAYRGALEYTLVSFIRGGVTDAASAAREEALRISRVFPH
jgi:hypothetical protein